MSTVQQKEIRAALRKVGLTKLDDEIVSKCVALTTQIRVSPKEMAVCWDTLSLNRNLNTLDNHSFDAFRAELLKHANVNSNTISTTLRKRSTPPSVTPPAKRAQRMDQNADTPKPSATATLNERRVSLSPDVPVARRSSSSSLYDERKGVGEVVHSWNPNELKDAGDDGGSTKQSTKNTRCVITNADFDTNVKTRYRHMNHTVEEVARILDGHLVRLGDAMKEKYGLGEDTSKDANDSGIAVLEAVGVPRQDPLCCIGRICNEAHEGRLNSSSVLLEGCREESGGTRIQLDLSQLQSNKTPFSLFPGQIVAVEGLNLSGRNMVVHRVCEGTPPKNMQTTAGQLLEFHHGDNHQGGSPLNIMVVSGPFATQGGLNYQPLWDFLYKVQATRPDVVVMTGPFVDMRQEAVKSGQTTVQNEDGTETLLPFESFFAEQISSVLQEFFANDDVTTQFVLVPSLHDATAEWVFPQAPFSDTDSGAHKSNVSKIPGAGNLLGLGTMDLNAVNATTDSGGRPIQRVHYMSNPCTLKINELVLCVSSADVLFDLGRTETNGNLPPGTRMGRLAEHLLMQQNFYPLFPGGKGTNLNLKKLSELTMPCQPDILITPSKLAPFARAALEQTVVVNPGFLTKGETGGTYATIQIHPMKRETLENVSNDGVELDHSVTSRSRVDIFRV